MRWHGKHMVRTAHPTARSIHPADFSGFKAPLCGLALAETKPRSCNPCGCETGAQKGSNPQQHGPTCGRVRRAHQGKILRRCTFPDVPGQQGGAALPGAADRHPPGHLIRFAHGPGKVRGTIKNRPVKRAVRMAAVGRSQGPLTGHPGHDRAATPISKL